MSQRMSTTATVAASVLAAGAAGFVYWMIQRPRPRQHLSAQDMEAIEKVNHDLARRDERMTPNCAAARGAIASRLGQPLTDCKVITVATKKGLRQALAITTAKMRGVTSADATIDLVSLAPTPDGAVLSEVADLDGDGADELVFVSERRAFVTRIDDFTFDDIDMPVPEGDCGETVAVQSAWSGPGKVIVQTLYGKCSGRSWHGYALRDGELVETD